jgi:hypothetical protein
LHARTYLLDDSGAFMTKNDGQRMIPLTVGLSDVRVTHAGGGDRDLDFAWSGIAQRNLDDFVRAPELVEHRGVSAR